MFQGSQGGRQNGPDHPALLRSERVPGHGSQSHPAARDPRETDLPPTPVTPGYSSTLPTADQELLNKQGAQAQLSQRHHVCVHPGQVLFLGAKDSGQ